MGSKLCEFRRISLPGVIPSPSLIVSASVEADGYKPVTLTGPEITEILELHGEIILQSVEDSDDVKRLQSMNDTTGSYKTHQTESYQSRLNQIISQSNCENQLEYLQFYVECSTLRSTSIYFKSILHQGKENNTSFVKIEFLVGNRNFAKL